MQLDLQVFYKEKEFVNLKNLTVKDLLEKHGQVLMLKKSQTANYLEKKILSSVVHRPGLSLTGYGLSKVDRRILLFGRLELDFLKSLSSNMQMQRLQGVVTKKNPLVIISRSLKPPHALLKVCEILKIPVLLTSLKSSDTLARLTRILSDAFSPKESLHGTLLEAFGIGILLQGESSVGKSETALGMIERGHRLISDDIVRVCKKEEEFLVGSGPELNRHLLEIRGIGIINVAHLFGAVSVKNQVKLDLIIHLEQWNNEHFYDRIGLEERFTSILSISIPTYMLPVKPGRDIILLLETTILNHRLKKMGYHTARDFNEKLLEKISKRTKVKSAY